MKKLMAVILTVVFGLALYGCGKKQVSLEEQEPLSMETLSAVSTNQTVSEIKVSEPAPADSSLTLPPPGPYKPGATQIQTALKNAGFYTGPVDGKIGPMSKKAIIEFQKANGLQADGKVGPKTWAALEKYLTASPEDASAPSQKTP